MKLTYYGHSCFSVEAAGKKLLFDPFITPNSAANHINISEIEPDYMLVSHGHEDHVADVLGLYKHKEATLVSNYEICTWFSDKLIKKAHPMNHGGSKTFEFGTVKYVNAIHTSSMPDGKYGGQPGGFVVKSDDKTFYFAGDTALTYDMKLIGEQFKLDFAVLPIGDNFTMGIDDAILACDFIKCNKILGVHYNTFPPITIDKEEAKRKFKEAGKELILLEIGETADF